MVTVTINRALSCERSHLYMVGGSQKEGGKHMTKEQFKNNTNWKMSYEEYQKCDCTQCDKENCIHREAYRRVPKIDGGLGLCPNLK